MRGEKVGISSGLLFFIPNKKDLILNTYRCATSKKKKSNIKKSSLNVTIYKIISENE